ncbi:MAG: DUF2252 family protein [Egibacteraceae bacterium]
MKTGVPTQFAKATKEYEAWLAHWMPLFFREDLKYKHTRMKEGPFPFLRATFYRWAQRWPQLCPKLAKAPSVLAVGDIHVQNYGTWRDSEGRLAWGVNDFDDAWVIPYTSDLVRLATSAELAEGVNLRMKDICGAILAGYKKGIREENPRPFVLAERNGGLRRLSIERLRLDPVTYWAKREANLTSFKGALPDGARQLFAVSMPEGLSFSPRRRVAGLGSLGRPRFVALADWKGGRVAREVKALAPSSWLWANPNAWTNSAPVLYTNIVSEAVRCPDPALSIAGDWVVRRLAPDSDCIDLSGLIVTGNSANGKGAKKRRREEDLLLLRSMGHELAHIHRGSQWALKAVRKDLENRRSGWLVRTADRMLDATVQDFKKWKKVG